MIRGSLKVNETTNCHSPGRNPVNRQQAAEGTHCRMTPDGYRASAASSSRTLVVSRSVSLPEGRTAHSGRRRSTPEEIRHALGTMNRSLVEDLDHYLERVLGEARDEPLTVYEFGKIIPRLRDCLWSLITDSLRQANGYPEADLKWIVLLAVRLDAEALVSGFVPTDPFARRLAGAVTTFRNLVSGNCADAEALPNPTPGGAG
ncbi:hypothetical protein [Streptomyces formicae]